MENIGIFGDFTLDKQGLTNLSKVYWNLPPATLIEHSMKRGEGVLTNGGGLVIRTGHFTGRAPNEKFVVRYGDDYESEIWWGKVNRAIDPEKFDQIYHKVKAYLQGRDVYVQDMRVGTQEEYTVPIRIVTEKPAQSLAARDLFLRLSDAEIRAQIPEFTVVECPEMYANPEEDGTNSGTFVLVNFKKKLVLIGGTGYAGEIKKSIFTVMNYLMPLRDILSMHCGANVDDNGNVALFFGLSGTGKTTLSADPERSLIGDDEHGWSDEGVFNFEGGCYAKTIRLRPELEPVVWNAVHRMGAVLENIIYDPATRELDFDDDAITENTRGAYPIQFVENSVLSGRGPHPKNVFFLTADAFGVIPPIARLTPEQAMYYFLSGYTSKLAGTETGIDEPQATFSACFGAPFLPLNPSVYAKLLGERVLRHQTQVWLVNTGWTGGPYGVGNRIKLPFTRAMVSAVLNGQLDDVEFVNYPSFGLSVPKSCPGVPEAVLNPRSTWKDAEAYDKQTKSLIERFENNFIQYKDVVGDDVVKAGPHN